MKPSERIKQLAQSLADDMAKPHRANLTQRADALPFATAAYLDEEAERRAAFEADVLKRLAEVERKTSSTETVTLYEEDPVLGEFARLIRYVKWANPEGHKPRDTGGEGA
jgi:hypothetical protein